MQSHNQISNKRKEMISAENDCNVIGKEVYGPLYKLPKESSRKIREKIALIQKHAKQIQPEYTISNESNQDDSKRTTNAQKEIVISTESPNKDVPCNMELNEKKVAQTKIVQESKNKNHAIVGIPSVGSALAHLRQSENATTFDPHKEFCRYELQGKCNDDSCVYQHQFPKF